MIEQKQSGALILQDGEDIQETIKMSLDLDSANAIMQILSKNLYSDSVGSCVRELSANSLDSMRAAEVTDRPIIVTLGRTNNGNYEFTVQDFGVGLSHKEVCDIISKYGKSTKKLSASQLGYYGLGWKSPLAYTSSFTFITRKDGIERKYIMSEGEAENIIDLIDENDTTEPNGVKVIVPVNSYDASDFYKKIKEQLCYFESIYFDVNYSGKTIDNNFKITRYDDFQLSELNEDASLHICLDNVYYPLDFKKLRIDVIKAPLGLRFGLSDGIFPVPSREAIIMSIETKNIILKKIKKVASKIVEMYNKSVEDTDDFEKIITHYSSDRRYIDVGHMQNVEITSLLPYSDVKIKEPCLTGVSLLNLKNIVGHKDEFVSEYNVEYCLNYGRMKERKHTEFLTFGHINGTNPIYKFSDRLGGNKKEYLKEQLGRSGYAYFVKKKRKRALFSNDKHVNWSDRESMSYESILNLMKHPKNEWRARIKEWLLIQDKYESRIKDADAVIIPKIWLDNRKAAKVSVKTQKNGHQKLEGEVSCKKAEPLERYVDGKNCKFTPFSIDLAKVQQTEMFYVYSSHEDSLKLDKLYEISGFQTITFITFSERELKKVSELQIHNLMSYDNFMKGETAIFKRLITAWLIHNLISKNSSAFRVDLSKVSVQLATKLKKLNKYSDNNYKSGSESLYTAMLEVAEKYSLFDHSIYGVYKEIKEFLEKFPFIEILCREIGSRYSDSPDSGRDAIIIDLLKYHKYKLNLECYKKVEETNEVTNN